MCYKIYRLHFNQPISKDENHYQAILMNQNYAFFFLHHIDFKGFYHIHEYLQYFI